MRNWDEEFAYLRERIDSLHNTLVVHYGLLERNSVSLEEHMRRTLAAEQRATLLEKVVEDLVKFRYYLMGAIALISVAGPLLYKRFL